MRHHLEPFQCGFNSGFGTGNALVALMDTCLWERGMVGPRWLSWISWQLSVLSSLVSWMISEMGIGGTALQRFQDQKMIQLEAVAFTLWSPARCCPVTCGFSHLSAGKGHLSILSVDSISMQRTPNSPSLLHLTQERQRVFWQEWWIRAQFRI